MILYELLGTEAHPAYQQAQIENQDRQYSFLETAVQAALAVGRPLLSQSLIKAFNYHAITCLHVNAGEYRPCTVEIGGSNHRPPAHYRVQALMDDFVNHVNFAWNPQNTDSVALAAYALWRLNWIHPFINGNGRTARITAYYIICVHAGGILGGSPILPELIKQNRATYHSGLADADASLQAGALNLAALHTLISDLMNQQVSSAQQPSAANNPSNP